MANTEHPAVQIRQRHGHYRTPTVAEVCVKYPMELAVQPIPYTNRKPWSKVHGVFNLHSCSTTVAKFQNFQQRKGSTICYALPETAISIAVVATVVGTAATILAKRTKQAADETQIPMKTCEDCGGSGICSECNGEGFVLKKLSEEGAERARLTAKNMATRYTAALPKKWSYCTKCSSARSCSTCGGRGKISL